MTQKIKSKLKLLALVFVISFLAIKPLYSDGNIPVHDDTHPVRLALLKQAVTSGQLPPIWADQANYQLGYPLFHFYAPIFYYLALLINIFGFSYTHSINLAVISSMFIGIMGILKLTQKSGKLISILSAVSFTYLPYLAVNIYVRGAYAEFLAICLLPWVFYTWKNLKSNKRSIISTSVITSAFLLSHNLIPLITLPFLIIWISLAKLKMPSILKTLTLSGLIASPYLASILLERNFVQAQALALNTDFLTHFVQPWQLWNSSWGFGGSSPGIIDGMSFKIGKPQITLAALGAIYVFKEKMKFKLFFIFMLLASIFFTIPASKHIWSSIYPLQLVQFPWRFLGLVGFSIAIISGHALNIFKSRITRLFAFIILTLGIVKVNSQYFKPINDFRIYDNMLINDQYIETALAPKIPEYVPSWSDDLEQDYLSDFVVGDNLIQYSHQAMNNHHEISITNSIESKVTIAKSYYPTWKLHTLEGQVIPISPSDKGLIDATLTSGTHNLTLRQSNTSVQRLAFAISLATLFISTMVLLSSRKGGHE